MEQRTVTCIGCPMGCPVTITMENDQIVSITGFTCPRGKLYAENEVTNPKRMVTSTVKVENGSKPYVSVKTREDIPKVKITDIMKCLKNVVVTAPVYIGDVIVADAAGTGVDIIATKQVEKE